MMQASLGKVPVVYNTDNLMCSYLRNSILSLKFLDLWNLNSPYVVRVTDDGGVQGKVPVVYSGTCAIILLLFILLYVGNCLCCFLKFLRVMSPGGLK